ncbi:MAG: DUF1934 domain-containing protein [Ruminococcus sp.]
MRYEQRALPARQLLAVADESLVTSPHRHGKFNLTLETGRKHFCLYQTPYGAMTIGVQAKRLLCELGVLGSVEMEYTIDMNADISCRKTRSPFTGNGESQENTGTKQTMADCMKNPPRLCINSGGRTRTARRRGKLTRPIPAFG